MVLYWTQLKRIRVSIFSVSLYVYFMGEEKETQFIQ